jgi:hypothetical protein
MGFTYQTYPIVGGTVLVIEQIESQNYVTGVSGWAIMANGDAEFSNLVARGSLIGGQVVINGTEYPNAIAFYTENPSEIEPAVIEPSGGVGNAGILRLSSPILFNGGSAGEFTLSGFDDGHTTAELDVDNFRFTAGDQATIEAVPLRLSGDFVVYHTLTTGFIDWEGETWHTVGAVGQPAFAGNWAVQGGVAVAFRKDSTGRVQLRGRATEPVALSAFIFTLPVGYRPSQNMSWAVKANNDAATVCWVQVGTNGQVSIIGNAAAARVQTVLDAISFPTT